MNLSFNLGVYFLPKFSPSCFLTERAQSMNLNLTRAPSAVHWSQMEKWSSQEGNQIHNRQILMLDSCCFGSVIPTWLRVWGMSRNPDDMKTIWRRYVRWAEFGTEGVIQWIYIRGRLLTNAPPPPESPLRMRVGPPPQYIYRHPIHERGWLLRY